MEIIYLGFDSSYAKFREHMDLMPWLCLSYNNLNSRKLKNFFNVTDFPRLIILRKNGNVATYDGFRMLMA